MKKSSIPTILIWVLYGLVSGICLFLLSMSVSAGLGLGAAAGLAAGLAVMFALGLLMRGLSRPVQRFTVRVGNHRLIPVIVESILFLLCLVGMTAYRLWMPWQISGDTFFESAVVTGETFFPQTYHGGAKVYLWLLHGAMVLLGNRTFAAIVLQLLLLFGAVAVVYYGVKKLSGAVAAFVTIAFIGFAPFMIAQTERFTPFLVFLIFYGLGVGCIAALPDRMSGAAEGSGGLTALLLQYFLTGIFIGICCYLDASGLTLLIPLTGVVCFGSNNDAPEEQVKVWGNGVTAFVCCLLTAAAAYVVSHVAFKAGGISLSQSVNGQMDLYLPGRFTLPVTVEMEAASWDIPLLVVLMAAGVFGFWYSRRIRDRGIWLFAAALLLLMQCLGMNSPENFNAWALLYLMCAIMAGCSVADLFAADRGAEETEGASQAFVMNDPEAAKDGMPVDEDETKDGTSLEMLDLQSGAAPAIHYIENPLPLPKKREHKVLDYDYEVADDDDFDIP